MNQINRLSLADAGKLGETVATCTGRGASARAGGEITVQPKGIGPLALHGATDAGRGSPTRVGGSKAGATHERWWTADEITLLRTLWRDRSIHTDAIPGLLRDRSRKAMRQMVAILKLGPRPKKALVRDGRPAHYAWTPEDDALLRSLWHSMSRHDIAARMERTAHSVSHRASYLRLGRSEFTRQVIAARAAALLEEVHERQRKVFVWTDEELAILRAHWPDIERIQARLGRSQKGIKHKAADLGLPPAFDFTRDEWATDRTVKAEERLAIRHERQPLVARVCLNCRRGFSAETRFLRLCEPCRGRSEGII